jgi:hypothetical protein
MWPRQKKPKVEGLIAYYDLTDWWLSSFTEDERTLIDERYQPMSMPPHTLTQGQRTSSLPTTEFLNALAVGSGHRTMLRFLKEYTARSKNSASNIRFRGQAITTVGISQLMSATLKHSSARESLKKPSIFYSNW